MKKFLTAIVLAMAIVSCGGGSDTASGSAASTFTFNLGEEGKSIDSALVTSSTGTNIHALISEGLTKIDRDQSIKPGLAESWDVSEDGLTWTFHLRDGIKWSNGDPITANDFKFAWLRALEPKIASEYAYMLYVIKGAEAYNSGNGSASDVAIKVIDDKTLEVELVNPTSYFESLVSFVTYAPVSEKFVTEKGEDYGLEAGDILSSGPFVLTSWNHNSDMVFERNANYYNQDDVRVDKIVAKFIQDSSAELNAFKNGEFNFSKLTAEQLEEYKNDENLIKASVATTWYLEFNTTNQYLKNKNIRKAILTSVDKESIVENVYRNSVNSTYTLTPKGLGTDANGVEFVDAVGEVVPKYNVEESKKYLEQGLKELGITEIPEISLIVNDSGTNKKLAEAVQEEVRKNLGININIELMAFKERLVRMQSKNFDIVLAGWGGDYQDPMTFLDLFVTGGGNNHTAFASPAYDATIKEASVTNDKAKRFEAFKTAEEILADELPIGPLFTSVEYYIKDNNFKGLLFPSVGPKYVLRYVEPTK